MGLGPLASEGGPPQPRYSSQVVTATRGCESSLLHTLTPLTSLDMASPSYPSLQDFCLGRLQAVLNNGFSVVWLLF